MRQKSRDRAREELWKRGEFLDMILDETQREMVDSFKNSESVTFIWLCSRRLGKSVGLIGTAFDHAMKYPLSRILYLSKTTDNVVEIVDQASSVILRDCPELMAPQFSKKENKFKFINGSEIRIKGLDNTGPDVIRGVGADLVIIDEFCFMRHLGKLVESVLIPMVIERNGRILMASTPPNTPGHESIDYIQKAEADGAIIKKTIYDCPRWTNAQIRMFEKEAGGIHSSTFRREYMCEIVVEKDKAILPSLTDEKAERLTRDEVPQDCIPHTYVSLDIGFRDLTVALFAYWDYENATLVVQDEIVLTGNSATTDNIARLIQQKEYDLWRQIPVYKRVCDTDPRLIADLRRLSNLHFTPTRKDNKEAQVNQLNIMIQRNQLVVSPKCKTLLLHMKYGIWNDARTEFARTKALGHCDALDSLLYLIRNIDRGANPYETPVLANNQAWIGTPAEKIVDNSILQMAKVFSRRR